ncbi:MAG: phospholipase D-like domain-containing protein [Bacteroidota bacterium]
MPDGRVLGALQLAALRGVDVRVLMPRAIDSILFKWVPYAYLPEAERAGVKVFLYEPGFMHQKVALVDRDFATVGTANFDNRSFRLNFEATVVAQDGAFCDQVADMLEADFDRATRITQDELSDRTVLFRFAAQATRLLAPIL